MGNKLISIVALVISLISLGFGVIHKSNEEKTVVEPKEVSSGSEITKETVVSIIKDTLINNPEIIMDSVDRYRMQKAKEALDQQKAKVLTMLPSLEGNEADPKVGPANASVKLITFFDYNCGYCKKMAALQTQLLNSDPDIQFIFKELPIMSQDSLTLSKAAISVYQIDPSKYVAFQDAIFNRNNMDSVENDIKNIATNLGIDVAKLESKIASPEVAKVIEDNTRIAQDIGIRGTPFYIINGEVIPGASDLENLKENIANARSKSKAANSKPASAPTGANDSKLTAPALSIQKSAS